MADRTAAALFSEVFVMLAEDPVTERDLERARKFWNLKRGYDFSPYQMYCDDALMKLGLAKRGPDPEEPERERVLYLGRDY